MKRVSQGGDGGLAKSEERNVSEAVRMAATALARHGYTNYDGLLKAGVSFNDAREAILESINSKIFEWHGEKWVAERERRLEKRKRSDEAEREKIDSVKLRNMAEGLEEEG